VLINRNPTLLVLRRRLVDAGDQGRAAVAAPEGPPPPGDHHGRACQDRARHGAALRSAGGERADPVRFPSNEHLLPHSLGPEHGVGADEVHHLKKNDGVGLEPEKPAMEGHAGECFKTCCTTGKAAGQENAAPDECKMQESNQASTLTVLSFFSFVPSVFCLYVSIYDIDSSYCCLANVLA